MKKIFLFCLFIFLISKNQVFSQSLDEKLKQKGIEFGLQLSQYEELIKEEKNKFLEIKPFQNIPLDSPAYRVACNLNYCVFSQRNGNISIYDLKNKKIIGKKTISKYPLYNVCFYPHKNIICVADREGKITIFNLEKKEKLHTLYELGKRLSEARFSPDGKYLAVGYLDNGEINLYETETYKNVSTIKAHTEGIYYLIFDPESKLIISASRDRKIGITPIGEKFPSQILSGHLFFVLSLDFSLDGNFLASGGGDGKLIVWRKNQNVIDKNIYFEWIHSNWVTTVKFFNDYLFSASRDGKIRIFDFINKKLLANFNCGQNIFSMDITPDGNYLIVSGKNEILLYNLKEILENIK